MNHPPANWNTDAFAERIVREVIRRLLAMEAQQGRVHGSSGSIANAFSSPVIAPPHRISAKLITAATLETIPIGTVEILIPSRAVVTPLARDEARAKGIRLTRLQQPDTPNPAAQQ